MTTEKTHRACVAKAEWYLDRIDALQRFMAERPRLDGDDVQMCQSMLREIHARFRADQRTPTSGTIVPLALEACGGMLAEAARLLKVKPSMRPTARWREELSSCRVRIAAYVDEVAAT